MSLNRGQADETCKVSTPALLMEHAQYNLLLAKLGLLCCTTEADKHLKCAYMVAAHFYRIDGRHLLLSVYSPPPSKHRIPGQPAAKPHTHMFQ